MKGDLVRAGNTQAHWNVQGTRILKYSLELYHNGLKEHKVISAPEMDILNNKVQLQIQKWSEKWYAVQSKQRIAEEKEASIEEANRLTEDAQEAIHVIENILIQTLSIDDTANWDILKKNEKYAEKSPSKPTPQAKKEYPQQPIRMEPSFSILDKIFKSRKEQKIRFSELKYLESVGNWENEKSEIDRYNLMIDQENEKSVQEWQLLLSEWDNNKDRFVKEQDQYNKKIDEMKEAYFNLNEDYVVQYCEMVLENSAYPEAFPKSFEIEYNPETRILIVEYQLPSLECFPTLKDVKYVATRKELKETPLSENQILKMFDESMYKITLRTIHELIEADAANAIDAISINGWVSAMNRATGKEENNCILSIQVKKNEFLEIDLANVDPKICFKSLKGVAGSKLSALTPVKPILQINKTDKRFVESYDVANQLDDTTNLAALDWEDFEHLIREVFEKEFQTHGGEVKVTQASRDGGVDAVAFDPDPIRGGKIVIQAKRYTNTVGLSAVRDLYGTVVNEGATKGILVSTADYGPDAYEFVKDKPLTLLNGSNLLHLLEKHGHHAKIDLREAKRILAEKAK
ncbi:restriction endonuclease [Cohnella terricola]|uniref:Restriction endonuclease n=1 Tax=Cohnella terricola TaxID=1289167 RepID=A0A559JGQ2_9BACL|nr:restriction endonuclease [Cohnella terricola]TVX99053.1 restriction endonuclease [Cohnella terricola]